MKRAIAFGLVCIFDEVLVNLVANQMWHSCFSWAEVESTHKHHGEYWSIAIVRTHFSNANRIEMPYQYLICVNFQTTSWDAYGSRKNDVEIIGKIDTNCVFIVFKTVHLACNVLFCFVLYIFLTLFFLSLLNDFLFECCYCFFCQLSEFSALLLNTESGLVESLFHHFVRPVHFPELSEYCRSLTGITQMFINQQKSFDDVYNKFLSWLRQNIVKRSLVFATPKNLHSPNGQNATFCTWSDWDLGHYLYRDCIRNEKSRYECMKAWIDIRRAFDVSYRCSTQVTFE